MQSRKSGVRGQLPLPEGLRAAVDSVAAAQRDRDPHTWQHQQRTADLAAAIGVRLGLPESSVAMLRLAASMHDIGKIGLLEDVVAKPRDLSEPEFVLVKTHCAIGYGILESLQVPAPVAQIVFQHHERLDGSGYPRGLSGDAILPEARILAVADAFDAMSSHRGYRRRLPKDLVLAELRKMAVSALDPEAVEACIAHVHARPGRRRRRV